MDLRQDMFRVWGPMAGLCGDQEHTSIWNSAFEWDNAWIAGETSAVGEV